MKNYFLINNLTVSYDKKPVLSGFNFLAPSQALIFITGENGAGKSTLLKAIKNLIPFSGEFLFHDEKINSDDIAYVSQNHEVNFEVKVKDVIVFGLYDEKNQLEGFGLEDYEKVQQIAFKLKIGHLLEKEMGALSGGQSQMVWIAQQLIRNKKIYLLDEPLHFLDFHYKTIVMDFLKQLSFQKLVICVMHEDNSYEDDEVVYLNL